VRRKKQPPGPAGDRYVVEVRGRQFFVINASNGMVVGVYSDRVSAQRRADALQSITYARFS
jgi:hypothetical protein